MWKIQKTTLAVAKFSIVFAISSMALICRATVITLPTSELPSESILPKLDNTSVVINRTVQKAKKASLALSYGNQLDEMFYNGQLVSLDFCYNTSEFAAWGIRWDQWLGGNTSYTDAFASNSSKLQFSKAPHRKAGFFVHRSFDIYYGRISLGKNTVKPMGLSWIAMAGAQDYETAWLPAAQGGGQAKIYLDGNISLGLQYLFSLYEKIDPTSTDVREASGTPKATSFGKQISFGQTVQLGLSYLF